MPYTLWSRGRLLGETAFSYECIRPEHRMGGFQPSEIGQRVFDAFTDDDASIKLESLEVELRDPRGDLVSVEHLSIQNMDLVVALMDQRAAERHREAEFDEEDVEDPELEAMIEEAMLEMELDESWRVDGTAFVPEGEMPPVPRFQIFAILAESGA